MHEGEAFGYVIKLFGGHADIREDAVKLLHADLSQHLFKVTEVAAQGAETFGMAAQPHACMSDGDRVLIHGHHGGSGLQQRLAMAAPAEGGVEKQAAGGGAQIADDFL